MFIKFKWKIRFGFPRVILFEHLNIETHGTGAGSTKPSAFSIPSVLETHGSRLGFW